MVIEDGTFIFEEIDGGLRLGVEANNMEFYNGLNSSLVNSIVDLVIPSKVNGIPVISLGYRCFRAIPNLETVFIPKTILRFEGDSFTQCTKLHSVTFEEGSRIVDLSFYAFYMTNLSIFHFPPATVIIRQYAFYGVTNLRFIYIYNHMWVNEANIFFDVPSSLKIYVPENYPHCNFSLHPVIKVLPPFHQYPSSFSQNLCFNFSHEFIIHLIYHILIISYDK